VALIANKLPEDFPETSMMEYEKQNDDYGDRHAKQPQ
jgi:hypothetical protein